MLPVFLTESLPVTVVQLGRRRQRFAQTIGKVRVQRDTHAIAEERQGGGWVRCEGNASRPNAIDDNGRYVFIPLKCYGQQ